MMNVVDNSIVSSDIGRNLFGQKIKASIFSGPRDRSGDLADASILFSSGGVGRVLIEALSTGQYAGSQGNFISCLLYRMSSNRFAIQMYTRDGVQIDGNVTSSSGMLATVDKFNADTDLNSDFKAYALTADVDVAFSTGVGYVNATRLTGGVG